MIYKDALESLQLKYSELIKKALPNIEIEPKTIEVVDHGLANGTAESFLNEAGLGISVRVIAQSRPGSIEGYTGKILAWLPNQFMPEHRHADIIAVQKGAHLNSEEFEKIEKHVNDFKGLKGFDNKKYDFFVSRDDKKLVRKEELPEGAILIPGKAETFDIIYGDGSFFFTGEPTKNPTYAIPEKHKDHAKGGKEVYAKPGTRIELKPNMLHSARAGPKGMVAIEYSLISRDEADIFTHPEIKRETEIQNK